MLDQHLGSIYEVGCINNKKFMETDRRINEIKKMVYGWMKISEKIK